MLKSKFELGRVVATSYVMEAVNDRAKLNECLYRHSIGDWGDIPEEDRELNEQGLSKDNPDRLMSSYNVDGVTVWVVTEADRSVTTILLPEDY